MHDLRVGKRRRTAFRKSVSKADDHYPKEKPTLHMISGKREGRGGRWWGVLKVSDWIFQGFLPFFFFSFLRVNRGKRRKAGDEVGRKRSLIKQTPFITHNLNVGRAARHKRSRALLLSLPLLVLLLLPPIQFASPNFQIAEGTGSLRFERKTCGGRELRLFFF